MKMYNNGQRKGMMYGGGATMRKPMNMGGLAETNRKTGVGQDGTMNSMGSMTEKKKFSMGMAYGGGVSGSKKKTKDFGLLSVKAGVDNNPKPTQADRIVGAKKKKMT